MKAESLDLIKYLSYSSVLVPSCIYFIKYKGLPKENHIIGVFIVLSLFFDVVTYLFANRNIPNAFIGNVYYLAAFLLLSRYYHEVVFQYKCKIYFRSGLLLYAISFFIVVLRQGFNVFQGELWAITGLILVVFGLIYNNYQVEKPPLLDKNLYSGLIFNAAIMFYFSFNFFLFLIANYVLTELSAETARMAWAFHNANNIIKNIAFAFGLYYTNRRRLNLTDEEIERIQWKDLRLK